MFLILLTLVYSLCLFFLYGFFFTYLLLSIYSNKKEIFDTAIAVIVLVGGVGITSLLTGLSILIPISGKLHVFFILGALAIFICFRKDIILLFHNKLRDISVFYLTILVSISLFSVTFSSLKIDHYDTGLYYAQVIKWLEHFHAVPGLANVHGRFGFDSAWLILAAFTGFGRLGLNLYQTPTVVLFVIFCAYLLHLIKNYPNNLLSGLGVLSLGIFIYIVFWHRPYNFNLASATTDLPAMVIPWWIFLLTIEFLYNNKVNYFPMIVLLSAFCLTAKLSSAPVLLIPIFPGAKEIHRGKLKKVILIVAVSFFLTIPWVIRNIILTGYLFYPFVSVDIFNFDWKVPTQAVQNEADWVTSWARIPGQDKNLVLSKSIKEWFPLWLNEQNRQDLFLFSSIIMLPLSWIFLRYKKNKLVNLEELALGAIALVGCVFWFIQAPHFRFGYGFLVPAFLFLVSPLVKIIYNRFHNDKTLFFKLTLLTIIFTMSFNIVVTIRHSEEGINLIFPSKYPVPAVKETVVDGKVIYHPSYGDQCWYDPFPCTPFSLTFHLRGDNFQEGFSSTTK
jgi:hypothetical protein